MLDRLLKKKKKKQQRAERSGSFIQTECGVCTQPYSLPVHRPMMICLAQHVICLACAKQISSIKSICPFCKTTFKIGDIKPYRGLKFGQNSQPYIPPTNVNVNSQSNQSLQRTNLEQLRQQNRQNFCIGCIKDNCYCDCIDYDFQQRIECIFGSMKFAKIFLCNFLTGLIMLIFSLLHLTDDQYSALIAFQLYFQILGIIFLCLGPFTLLLLKCMAWVDGD